jgi:hypothetical protein
VRVSPFAPGRPDSLAGAFQGAASSELGQSWLRKLGTTQEAGRWIGGSLLVALWRLRVAP